MKNQVAAICLLALLPLFTSCEKKNNHNDAPAAVRVKTMAVGTTDLDASTVYSGTVEEWEGTTVSFPVAGTLTRMLVDDGDHVSKGQLIAELDRTNLQNAYDIAKATLDQAQDAYNRMKQLHDSNSLPDMQWVEVQNTLRQAQSGEAIAKRALRDGLLYAPAEGYVSQKFVENGMTVAPVQPIVKISRINPVKVSISLPESDIAAVALNQKANIKVSALDNAAYTGTVTEKGIDANPLSRTYSVKMRVDNPGLRLLPGMICDVTLASPAPRSAIVLPPQAVLIDADNSNFVWLDRGGKAEKRIVQVDGLADGGVIIGGGLAVGDSVIVEGQQKVSNGTAVQAL